VAGLAAKTLEAGTTLVVGEGVVGEDTVAGADGIVGVTAAETGFGAALLAAVGAMVGVAVTSGAGSTFACCSFAGLAKGCGGSFSG
jgi:hypothetical protein